MLSRARQVLALSLALCVAAAVAAEEPATPQYGGTLTVGSEFSGVSATAWDPADWHWKINHDAPYLEHLFVADLAKSAERGGTFRFTSSFWIPDGVLKGELAESWEFTGDPLTLVVRLRKGVMWPDKPGVMTAREFVADDVVFSFNRVRASPKALKEYYEYIDRIEARDEHTVVFHLKAYNTEWARRFGYGLYCGILPREAARLDLLGPKNAIGTGPFLLESYRDGSAYIYARNPGYWAKEGIGGTAYRLPFVDKLIYPVLKDSAGAQAALRTGRLDILRNIPWQSVEALKQSSPQLVWHRRLSASGTFIALRMDTKPFDSILVRRAVNMAINRQEIVDKYYGGNAEPFNHPMYRDWRGYYQPLAEMPASVKELFLYDPERAKQLLRAAGYPAGFVFDVQVSGNNSNHLDLLAMVAGYLQKVGVTLNIKPMEYAPYASVLKNSKHAAGYMMTSAHITPISTLSRHFSSNIFWNASRYRDPALDERLRRAQYIRDERERIEAVREMTVSVLEKAPYILLPTPIEYEAWWPWVKNYNGERYAGALRPGPIYARIWIDQSLKKTLGF
ncbi:MAG: ABC transporter substrate-binding protein [Hyphomicrobiaceae bacterium]|nr:MAG: ABC transporter substrate-binding protein [Hyphomicrobiaceae bacterium]